MNSHIRMLGGVFAATMLIGSVPYQANAAALWCYTKVASVTVNPTGYLYVSFENMGQPLLCDMNANLTPADPNIATIKPDVCKSWYASFLSHLNTQKPVAIAINFAGTPPTCSQIPVFDWAVPNPYPYWIAFLK